VTPAECREGVVVSHAETGATGTIIRGGYRPRVQWHPNGRIVRTEETLLRVVAADEVEHRAALRAAY
jgi:hypothetical protein